MIAQGRKHRVPAENVRRPGEELVDPFSLVTAGPHQIAAVDDEIGPVSPRQITDRLGHLGIVLGIPHHQKTKSGVCIRRGLEGENAGFDPINSIFRIAIMMDPYAIEVGSTRLQPLDPDMV